MNASVQVGSLRSVLVGMLALLAAGCGAAPESFEEEQVGTTELAAVGDTGILFHAVSLCWPASPFSTLSLEFTGYKNVGSSAQTLLCATPSGLGARSVRILQPTITGGKTTCTQNTPVPWPPSQTPYDRLQEPELSDAAS